MRVWILVLLAACADKEPAKLEPAPAWQPEQPTREPQAAESGSTGSSSIPGGDTKTPQPFHEQAEAATKPAEATVLTYRATWANVKSTPPCWYFSGPAGRDTPLGERIEVRIDGGHASTKWSKATFEGTWGDSAIDVLRLATHSYQGTWVISERLKGTVKEKGIHAKYTYSECQQGTPCPGECKITADVLLVPE